MGKPAIETWLMSSKGSPCDDNGQYLRVCANDLQRWLNTFDIDGEDPCHHGSDATATERLSGDGERESCGRQCVHKGFAQSCPSAIGWKERTTDSVRELWVHGMPYSQADSPGLNRISRAQVCKYAKCPGPCLK